MSDPSEKHRAEIEKFIKQGKKMQAIKYARDAYNISLKDSVRLVNTVDQELNPDKKIDIDSFSQGGGMPKIFYYVFGIAGVGMILGASYLFYDEQSFATGSVKTIGEVIDYTRDEDASYPVVRYNWEGEEFTYYSSTGSNPPPYEIGEQVELLIDPLNPNKAMINSFLDRFLGITILGGLGVLFVGILYIAHKAFSKQSLT